PAVDGKGLDQPMELADPWEVSPTQVTFQDDLGQGAFGKVYKAELRHLPPALNKASMRGLSIKKNKGNSYIVAVKSIHEQLQLCIHRHRYLKITRYTIMKHCWEDQPKKRPTFSDLRMKFEYMLEADNPYLDLSEIDETKDYYLVPSFNSAMETSADNLEPKA
ncbi:predicted protein, partial [Nematostella vectensis]